MVVDGNILQFSDELVYLLLYKPSSVITSVRDPEGRRTVLDVIGPQPHRVYPVGRLDYETSGVLILTNDGTLANQLMHPRFGIDKTYEAVVTGHVSAEGKAQLENGIELDGRMTSTAIVRILGTDGLTTRLQMMIHEGRNRQVRRMLEAIGHPCEKLLRVQYGPLTLQGLRPGQWRVLTTAELLRLQQAAQGPSAQEKSQQGAVKMRFRRGKR